ncbi:MAG: polysaccharide biosynthesis tyrosine autokinase [Desulfobacca sp.]|uniref:polysaccharide biosynthesis tyrosine autokinase n=1 Tax=Desulfobacca sp. TaxID=2067990 RepID=UPI00404951D3
MSFIDKALERAKATRQQETTPAGPQTPAKGEVQKPLPVVGNLGATGAPLEICYTVTKTVPVDLEFLKERFIIAGDHYPAVAEEYKLLRTHILHRTKKDHLNTIMFTGPRPKEGKSLTTINVAISIAQEVDQTVLIVDADLRNPSIHSYFGLPGKKGLVDFLKGGVPIPELLIHPEGIHKLVVLPAGKPITDAAELIKSPQMVDLVQELKHCYSDRYVLFDLPPILNFADALAFAPLVDGIILVVEAGRTAREEIEQSLNMLKDFNILGFVVNKVKRQVGKDTYYYDYAAGGQPSRREKFFG